MYTLPVHSAPPSGLDLFQVILAFALWIMVVVVAAIPLLAPHRWPLRGTGWNVRRLHRIFPLLLLVALAVWRAPNFVYNGEHDVDESAFLAIAHQFTHDPVPWRSADTQTSGPLNAYALDWAPLLGLPLNYNVATLTGFACIFVTLLLQLKSVSLIVGRRRSLIIIAAAATFYFFGWHYDDERYESEYIPVALLTAAGWLILALRRNATVMKAFLIGLFCGAVPFAKLQAAPVAVYLFAVAAALFFLSPPNRLASATNRLRLLLALAVGGLAVPLLVMLPVFATGTGPDFLKRYILNGLHYHRGMLFADEPSYLSYIRWCLEVNPFVDALLLFSTFLVFVKFAYREGRMDREWLTGWALLGGYVVISILVVLKTKLQFFHYLLLPITPLLLFVAWAIRGMNGAQRPRVLVQNPAILPIALLFLCVVPQLINYGLHFSRHPWMSDRPPDNPVIPALQALSRPGDTMAIWGWTPEYYVRTGLRPATHEVNGFYIISPGSAYDSYRECFIADMEKSKPRLFVDSAGAVQYPDGWPHPAARARYTNYPEVAAYIDAHYHFESQVSTNDKDDPPVMIYVRNDAAPASQPVGK